MATKVSLRQFQQDLAQRLSSAKTAPVSAARLGVQCGASYWLIALDDAGEILPVPEVLPVPLTKPWYLGVANIRGGLFSVVDFAAFAGGEPAVRGSDSRLVLAGPRFGINAALLVTRMLGLRNARDMHRASEGAAGGATGTAAWAGPAWHEGAAPEALPGSMPNMVPNRASTMVPGTPPASQAASASAAARVWRELKFEHLIESPDFLNVGV